MEIFWHKGTAKLIKLQSMHLKYRNLKNASWIQEPMALVTGLPELPSLPPTPTPVFPRGINAEKLGCENWSTDWYKKEAKFLIPEAQQWKLTKSLHDATHYGMMHYGTWCHRLFQGGGKKNSKTNNACLIYMPATTHRSIQYLLYSSGQFVLRDISRGRLAVRSHPNVCMIRT